MNQMFEEMLDKLKDSYTEKDLDSLLDLENDLKLKEFNSDIALEIGSLIVKESKKYNEDLIVKITRLSDNATVFQYIGSTKAERNIGFADMKANSTKITGHSSIYALINKVVNNGSNEVFENDNKALPVAGAFPLYVEDEMVAIIAVSGMHNGLDQTVIIEGLAKYLNKTVKSFEGILV